MHGLVSWLTGILPPTIHPMVVHFPIAFLYLTLLLEACSYVALRGDRFFARASFWALFLSLVGIVAAGAAGVISEHAVTLSPQTARLLSAHQRDAVLTGLFALGAFGWRLAARFPRRTSGSGWSILHSGRGRPTPVSTLLILGAVIMISITGSLGGTMVYGYGVGTPSSQARAPKP